MKKLVEDGKIGFEQLEKGFVSLTSEGGKFFGLTEKQSQSLGGRLNTLGDNLTAVGKNIFTALGPALKAVTNAFIFLINNIGILFKVLGIAAVAFAAYQVVVNGAAFVQRIYTATIVASKKAIEAFNATLASSPYGIIAAAVAALIAAYFAFRKEVNATTIAADILNKNRADASAEIEKETAKTKVLVDIAKDEKKSKEERKKAIEDLKQISPEYFGQLDSEKIKIADLTIAYGLYIDKITAAANAKALQNSFEQLSQKISDINTGIEEVDAGIFTKAKDFLSDAAAAVAPGAGLQLKASVVVDKQRAKKDLLDGLEDQRKTIGEQLAKLNTEITTPKAPANPNKKDNPIAGSLAAERADVEAEFKKLTEKTKLGSEAFSKQFEIYQQKKKALIEKEKVLNEQFPKDSLKFLQDQVSEFQKALNEVSQTDPNFDKIQAKLNAAQQKLIAAQNASDPLKVALEKAKADAQAENFLLNLQKANGVAILDAQKRQTQDQLELTKAKFGETSKEYKDLQDKLKEIDLKRIEEIKNIDKEKLDMEADQAIALLEISKQGKTDVEVSAIDDQITNLKIAKKQKEVDDLAKLDDKYSNTYEKAQNELVLLQADAEAKKTAKAKEEKEKQAQLAKEAAKELVNAAKEAVDQIIASEIALTDAKIQQQQTRVDAAKNIADKGNSDILKEETKRLNDLQKERAKAVRAQQALAAAELIANSAVAVSKAAAQSGIAAPIGVAAVLIALFAGLAKARQAAQAASFYKGGAARWSDMTGFTGSGSVLSVAHGLGDKPYEYHREEFVMNNRATKNPNNRALFEFLNLSGADYTKIPSLRNKVNEFEARRSSQSMTRGDVEDIVASKVKISKVDVHVDRDGIYSIWTDGQNNVKRLHSKM